MSYEYGQVGLIMEFAPASNKAVHLAFSLFSGAGFTLQHERTDWDDQITMISTLMKTLKMKIGFLSLSQAFNLKSMYSNGCGSAQAFPIAQHFKVMDLV